MFTIAVLSIMHTVDTDHYVFFRPLEESDTIEAAVMRMHEIHSKEGRQYAIFQGETLTKVMSQVNSDIPLDRDWEAKNDEFRNIKNH